MTSRLIIHSRVCFLVTARIIEIVCLLVCALILKTLYQLLKFHDILVRVMYKTSSISLTLAKVIYFTIIPTQFSTANSADFQEPIDNDVIP